MTKRCLIMAGGTGGHVFPGLALARALRAKAWQVDWLGTAQRMEAQLVPKHGLPIHFIDVRGLRGKSLLATVQNVFLLLGSIFAALALLRKLKPDIVVGFGGYASGPGGIAARILGIPLVIHEQNATAGMTNRWLAKLARAVMLGFADAAKDFPSTTEQHVTGNPVRDEFFAIQAKHNIALPLNILILGGSLGARPLNEQLPALLSAFNDVRVWHQCGKNNQGAVYDEYLNAQQQSHNDVAKVVEFIDDMASAMQWADIVICRAGALTVAEVSAASKAAIFVPLPHAVDDHQTKNAQSLAEHDAAMVIPQHQLATQLPGVLQTLLDNPQKCLEMGARARKLAHENATRKALDVCMAVLGEQQ